MILPKKHVTIHESLVVLAGFIFKQLKEGDLTVDELWLNYNKINNTKKFPAKHNFDDLILAIDILYGLKKINITEFGQLKNETS